MSRPKAKSKKRSIDKKFEVYFYACVAVFFILLAVILYYSFGYKYSIEDGKTVQVGAIVIRTEPKKSFIHLNEKLFENSLFENLFSDYIKIKDLEPKTYNLKIKKNNYFTWEKNIAVQGGYVTEFNNVVLLKNNYENKILLNNITTDAELNNIWVSNRKNKIAYQKINKEQSAIFVFNLENKKRRLITNHILLSKEYENYCFDNLIWSDNDQKIILKANSANNNDKYSWYLIDLKNNNETFRLDNIFENKKEIKNKWNFHFSKSLFYLKNNVLYKLDYDKLTSQKIIENIASFSVIGNDIYYFEMADNILYSTDHTELDEIKNILTMPDNFNSDLPSKIIKSNQNTFLILSNSGDLYFADKNNELIFINPFVKNAYFSSEDKRIIYNNDHEIWVYYLDEKISQPSKKENLNELITRYSGKINKVFLFKDEEHLFYQEGKIFKFMELDNRDKANVFDILETENSDTFYSRDSNSIYYVKNNNLLQIKLDEK